MTARKRKRLFKRLINYVKWFVMCIVTVYAIIGRVDLGIWIVTMIVSVIISEAIKDLIKFMPDELNKTNSAVRQYHDQRRNRANRNNADA